MIRFLLASLLMACGWAACSRDGNTGSGHAGAEPRTDTSSQCQGNCDAAAPAYPLLTDTSGYGNVTTYGYSTDPGPSRGGACNYGETGILAYAAIQANRLPGDGQGQWRAGRVCGQCAEVRARTPSGWKSTVVRIMDECPDPFCGIDLGGAPARDLMGDKPGRYAGEWTFAPCDRLPGLSDGPPALFVKEGSNAYWSLVHVRNPLERVLGIRFRRAGSASAWTELSWAEEAENFFRVPDAVLKDTAFFDWEIGLPHGKGYVLNCRGTDLAKAGESLTLEPL